MAVLFAIEPPTSVHFFTRVYISAIAVLLIVFPLTLVSGAIAIVVDTAAGFEAFGELAFELVAVGVEVEPVAVELIVFPVADVGVFGGEDVDAFACSDAGLEKALVETAVFVLDFFEGWCYIIILE